MQVDVCFGSKADVRQVQSARPLWVISRHCIKLRGMSALPPIADMLSVGIDVR